MPRPYPPEFGARAVALVRSGKQVNQTAYELGISAGCLHTWLKQDRIDRGEIPGNSTAEPAELRAARRRIRELGTELSIILQASNFRLYCSECGCPGMWYGQVVSGGRTGRS
ncbi:Insertion element IS6110 uncharacterized 12.0 kDa protein [Rhodococcus sp. B50]|nr:Insertion element IS6110 uncharacterized 12.0 kDa protein [Rhodococcus sp. B50]